MSRAITPYDSYMVNQSKRTHANPLLAVAKEQASNGFSHAVAGVKPWQRYSLVQGDRQSKSVQYLMCSYNSDASKFLNPDDPFDGSHMASMLDVGHNPDHDVKDHSQFNTGNNNTDFAFGADCHTERFFYNASTMCGSAIIYTRPILEDDRETRARTESTMHIVYYAGFKVDNSDPDRPIVKFFRTMYPTEDVMKFLLHSRLTGDGSNTIFCPTSAMNTLSGWILNNVVNHAHSDSVPGTTAFVYVVDTSTVTYTDPISKSVKLAFSESGNGDICYHYVSGGGAVSQAAKVAKVSLRMSLRNEYLLPNNSVMKQWKCENGTGMRDLSDYDVGIINNGNVVSPISDSEGIVRTLTEEIRKELEVSGRITTHATFHFKPTDDDIKSLGITSKPDTVPVTSYYVGTQRDSMSGVVTMWRNKLNRVTESSKNSILSLMPDPLTTKALYGINNANTKRDAFVLFCSSAGFECDVVEPKKAGGSRQYFMTDEGVRKFKARFGKDPSVVFHNFEKYADSHGKNQCRRALYMGNIIVVLQLGNLCPDYNKEGCTESQDRWTAILNEAVCGWMSKIMVKTGCTGSVADAVSAGYSVVQEKASSSDASSSASDAPSAPSASVAPAAAADASSDSSSSSSTLVVKQGKRPADSASPEAAKRQRNRGRDVSVSNIKDCCALLSEKCDQFIKITKSYAQMLHISDPSSASLEACNKRILRLIALKAEADNGNHAVMVRAPPTTMLNKCNVSRVATIQVFWTVVGGIYNKDMPLLNAGTLNPLFEMVMGSDVLTDFKCLNKPNVSLSDTDDRMGYIFPKM